MISNHKSPKVALVVLNYNCQPFIKSCLNSLLRQKYKNKKVFFIDNHSSDASVSYVQKHYPQVILIKNKKNFGIGKGFNVVIKKVINDFDYFGLFNTDIKADKNWLYQLIDTFSQNPNIEVANGLTFNWQGDLVDNAGGTIINFFNGIIGGFLDSQTTKNLPLKYKNHVYPVFFSLITGMLVKTSAFKKVGFFAEDYFMFCEEFDFCWRVLLTGSKVICNPKATMRHYTYHEKRNKIIVAKILKLTETNLLATYYKNLSSVGLLTVFPILIMARFFMAVIYIAIVPKVAFLKTEGIALFFKNLFRGKYHQSRRLNLKIRKLSDQQILSVNPTNIFNIKTIFNLALSWFKTVYKDYSA